MKLNIENITFKNFYSFGAIQTEWPIVPGIHLITGKNLITGSGNGVGKSSLGKTLPFSLFGKVADVNQSQLINWKNRKGLETEIFFTKGPNSYKICRGIKPNILKVFKNDEEIDQPSSKITFQEYIEQELLGFDYDSFMNLIYSDLNNFTSIFSISKQLKRKFLEHLFNLEEFSLLSETCKDKISSLNISIADLRGNIQTTQNNIKNKTDLQVSLEGSLCNFSNFEREYRDFQNSLVSFNKDTLLKRKKELEDILQTMSNENEKLEKIKNNLDKKIAVLYDKVIHREYIGDDSFDEEKLIQVEKELSEIDTNFDITEIEKSIQKKIEHQNSILEQLITIENRKIELDVKLDFQKAALNELKNNSICPTCKRKISSAVLTPYEKEILILSQNSEEITSSYTKLKEEKLALMKEINVLKDKEIKITTAEKRYNYLFQQKELLERDKQDAQINAEKKILLDKSENSLKILTKTQSKLNDRYEKYSQLIEAKQIEYKTITNKYNEYLLLESKKSVYENTHNQNLLQKTEIKEKISLISTELENLHSNLREYNKEVIQKEKLKDYIEFIRSTCKDENIKQFAISKFMPFLNTKVNEYIAEAGQNFYLKLDNFLDLEIKGIGVGENSQYGNFSGGERRIVNLAMQMAFLDVAKIQAKVQPNVLILDELLDTSVDTINLQRILKIIKKKQQEENLAIYIISHRNEIENVDFDSVCYVTKEKNGYSKLEIRK